VGGGGVCGCGGLCGGGLGGVGGGGGRGGGSRTNLMYGFIQKRRKISVGGTLLRDAKNHTAMPKGQRLTWD